MSIDNNAIVNHTCDNISHIYNSVNLAINEASNDPQILMNKDLTDPSNTFPSSLINNVPNGTNFGEIAVWNGSTWTLEGSNSISIGQNAGLTFQGGQTVAIGVNAGRHNQNTGAISIGWQSGRTHQGTNAISIGLLAGSTTQGLESIAIGQNAAQLSQGDRSVAVGSVAGLNNQRLQAIAMGYQSGAFEQGTNSIAIGVQAGFTSQGQNSIAIGNQAGMTAQPESSIVINAGNVSLSGITQNSCYINPIRNVVTGGSSSNLMCYDTTNRKIVHASNINFLNPVSFPLGTVTQTSVHFGTPGTGYYSSSTNSLDVSTAGFNRLNLTGSRLLSTVPFQLPTGSVTQPSLYFTETNSGIFRPTTNQIAITTNGTTRLNVGTGTITCALGLALPTVGGTATNLDHYEETTHATTFTYGNRTSANTTITIRRIGRIVSIFIPYTDHLTNTNGSNVGSFSNTALLSRFRPQNSVIFPINVQNNLVFSFRVCLIRADGVIEILDVNQGGFANNTRVESYASNFTYFL